MVQLTHEHDLPHTGADWLPAVRSVPTERPWDWLAAAWRDMTANPTISVAYGLVATISSFVLFAGLAMWDLPYLILPLAGGFMLLGPVFAVGLYESSRVREARGTPTLAHVTSAYRGNVTQLAFIGSILLIMFMGWIRMAFLLFMLFFSADPPSFDLLIDKVFFSSVTAPFLLVGTVIGMGFAAAVFSVSVIAVPMLLDRDTDAFTAMATSIKAVKENPRTMLVWAALIALFTSAGIATGFVGLALAFPLIGHASWHCYRDVVERERS